MDFDQRAGQSPDRLPVLLDLKSASAYTGLPEDTCRSLVVDGRVPKVRLPSTHGGLQRRIWTRREDWDAFFARHLERNVEPAHGSGRTVREIRPTKG